MPDEKIKKVKIEGKKRALIVGVNDYDDRSFDNLKYAKKDAKDLSETLEDKNIGGFDDVILLNEATNTTKSEVERHLVEILNRTEKDDLLLFYFAGHGKLDKARKLCLATRDTKAEMLRVTSLPFDTLDGLIEESKCQRMLFSIDSCYSGASGGSERGGELSVESFTRSSEPPLGRITISASQATKIAREKPELEHGIFTFYLLEGLKKKDLTEDGDVSIGELYEYVEKEVKKDKQTPTKWGNGESNFIIVQHLETVEKRKLELEKADLEQKTTKLIRLYEEYTTAGNEWSFEVLDKMIVPLKPYADLTDPEKEYRKTERAKSHRKEIDDFLDGQGSTKTFVRIWTERVEAEHKKQEHRPNNRPPEQDRPLRRDPVLGDVTPIKTASATMERQEPETPRTDSAETLSKEERQDNRPNGQSSEQDRPPRRDSVLGNVTPIKTASATTERREAEIPRTESAEPLSKDDRQDQRPKSRSSEQDHPPRRDSVPVELTQTKSGSTTMEHQNANIPRPESPEPLSKETPRFVRTTSVNPEERLEVGRDQVVIVYHSEDREWFNKLQRGLKPYVNRETKFKVWDDTKIKPGTDWRREINKALEAAKVAVLLVSQDFLGSDFIDEHELPSVLNAAQEGNLVILWVAVRPFDSDLLKFERYRAVHDASKPLASLKVSERDKELIKICKTIVQTAGIEKRAERAT